MGCKVWTEWGTSRNKKLLSDEALFSCKTKKLSAQLINYWLCRFVLEICWHDGEQYPLALLYQLCYGFLCHLCAAGQAKVSIFEQAEFHASHYSEMKCLNNTNTLCTSTSTQYQVPLIITLCTLYMLNSTGDHSH